MKFILRNMWRRRAIGLLGILVIGVIFFALASPGCLSDGTVEKAPVNNSWLTGRISVLPEKGLFGAGDFLALSIVHDLEFVNGVKAAVAGIGLNLDKDKSSPATSESMFGYDLSKGTASLEFVNIDRGRILKNGDSGKALLGSDLAEKYGADVGDMMDLHGKPFEVIGVYETTLSDWDVMAFVCYRDAMDILLAEGFVPPQAKDVATFIDVFPEEGEDMEILSQRIASRVSGIRVVSPREMEEWINAGNTAP